MATKQQKEMLLQHWNSKKIIIHKRVTPDAERELTKLLKHYTLEEIFELVDFYATILEPGVPEHEQKYFWTHKWNLFEFLRRGVPKFDGQEPDSYRKQQMAQQTEALVFKR